MKIKFEMEPGERKNIITMTEAFINTIATEYFDLGKQTNLSREHILKLIIANLKNAAQIIESETDRRYEEMYIARDAENLFVAREESDEN